MIRSVLFVLLLATGAALAGDAPAPESKPAGGATDEKAKSDEKAKGDEKAKKNDDANLGMSILGNQEAPKALVIVPWKSSEIGASLGVSTLLDDSRQPIDKEVFMRVLSYYELREAGGRGTAGAETGATQPATATHRRKS